MERFVTLISPQGKLDFASKTLFLLLVFGALNFARDVLVNNGHNDGFYNNFLESAFVGLPFVVFALSAFGHLQILQDRLHAKTMTDFLTGLPNRPAFFERIERPPDTSHGDIVMMVDVDHFKRVNDSFGHDLGDECLKQLALFFRVQLRKGDMVARLGGEEFAINLERTSLEDAMQIGARLAKGCLVNLGVQNIRVTLSIGCVQRDADMPLDTALRLADVALYKAKADGRACVRVSDRNAADIAAQTIKPEATAQAS